MNWTELMKFLFTNKVMKVIIITIAIIITLFFGLILFKAAYGEHVKIFGCEINDKPVKQNILHDTILVTKKTGITSKSNLDTPTLKRHHTKENTSKWLEKTPLIKHIPIDTGKNQKRVDIEFKAPITSSPMQFGNNNTQNNQITGKLDHHPIDQEINAIFKMLPFKNRKLTLKYQTQDFESKNYCIELKEILNNYGYNNVIFFPRLTIGAPAQKYKIQLDTVNYVISVEWN